MEEFGFPRRAICFESNEGTVATECKVDFVEIVDSNDESISKVSIVMKAKSPVVMKVKSKMGRRILSRYVQMKFDD